MAKKLYNYSCEIIRVVDGDTLLVMIDLGFDVHHKVRLRLAEIDTPPAKTEEGKKATEFVKKLALENKNIATISTSKQDRYGRWIAKVTLGTRDLSSLLLKEGLAEKIETI